MRAETTRAALFDAAGTLLRLRESVGTSYARFATNFGVNIPAAQLEDAFRRIFAQMPTPVFPGKPKPEIKVLEKAWWHKLVRRTFRAADSTILESHFRGGFQNFFQGLWDFYSGSEAWQAAPEAEWLLDRLRSTGWRVAVVSNFDHRLPTILAAAQLLPKLEAVILPSEAGAAKPDPAIFRFALQRLALSTTQTVYIGDHPVRDLEAARACGLHAIDVREHASLRTLYPAIEAALPSTGLEFSKA